MSNKAFLLALLALIFSSSAFSSSINNFAAAPNTEQIGEELVNNNKNQTIELSELFKSQSHVTFDEISQVQPTSPIPIHSQSKSNSNHSRHSMHTMQLPPFDGSQFTMELMTGNAPWSARMQPALLYMRKETRYTQWATNVTVSQGAPWLILYEGSFTVGANNSVGVNENDVWASGDYGRTWDLMAGVSRFGSSGRRVESKYPRTFESRGFANNCEDPASDYIFSLGGWRNEFGGNQGTNDVWYSSDGLTWKLQAAQYRFGPSRYSSSCDVDESGHIYTMGGVVLDNNYARGELLNDVWQSSIVSGLREWRRITTAAPWEVRANHLVMIGNSPVLQKELIYVIGGQVSDNNTPVPRNTTVAVSNDVWVSSDGAQTWVNLVENGENYFPARWGHSGVITSSGVLIVFGGSYSRDGSIGAMANLRDLWASFDGGIEWNQCLVDNNDNGNVYIRTQAGVSLTDDGELLIASGYAYGSNSNNRTLYKDVWKTPFSLDDTQMLADMCGTDIPLNGIGLTSWPRPTLQNTFAMTVQTRRAPWSARIQPAILSMSKPITYVQAGTKLKISTPPNWLLMYEGSLTYGVDTEFESNENDVWASADNGQSWDLISGITRNGSNGLVYSSLPYSSFSDRAASANCEDPTNDDVFSLGGYSRDPYGGEGNEMSNEVWHSSDALRWTLRAGGSGAPGSFLPRYFSQCVVNNQHQIYLAGGELRDAFRYVLFNDVWVGSNTGRNWRLVLGRAPWVARSEHVFLLSNNQPLGKTVLYVMGGFTNVREGEIQTTNDVWVSSDGGAVWARVTDRAPWIKRWGHAGAVTRDGALVVIGGSDSFNGFSNQMQTWRDGWVSLDGGYQWFQLRLTGDVSFIRGEQGVALTADEHLMLVSGYSFTLGQPRTDYADLWISNITFSDARAIIRVSEAGASVPSAGVGLRQWPGTTPSTETFTPLVIGGIVGGGVLLLVIALCLVYRKRNNRLPSISMPSFLSPRSSRRAPAPSNGDYFTSSSGRDSDKYSFSDSSSLSDHYQPPTGGYQPPAAHGGYQPPSSHHGHNGDSHGLLS